MLTIFCLIQSRNIDRKNPAVVKEANMYYAIESGTSLFIRYMCLLYI